MRRAVSGKAVFHPRRQARQQSAAERQAISSAMTPAQRLAVLDERLGEGKGAIKERIRLHERMHRAPAPTPVVIHGSDTIAAPAEPRNKRQRRQRREEKRS